MGLGTCGQTVAAVMFIVGSLVASLLATCHAELGAQNTLLWFTVSLNIFTLLIFGLDKNAAINDRWRVSEVTLLSLMFMGGPIGAWVGMYMFRHKVKKIGFLACGAAFTVFSLLWPLIYVTVKAKDLLPQCYPAAN